MTNILWFRKIDPKDISRVGKKAIDLNNLYTQGFNVPSSFIVTKTAYDTFYSQISHRIDKFLVSIDFENQMLIKKVASEVQKIILDSPLPEEIEREIEEAYDCMNVNTKLNKTLRAFDLLKSGTQAEVAIRISPISDSMELIKNSEFASFLNVTGISQVKKAVKAAFASIFSSNNIIYRAKNGHSQGSLSCAVIIQKMIKSDKSAILYSKNPENFKNEVMIRACFGLGKTLEEIYGNCFILEPERSHIVRSVINPQTWAYYGDTQGKTTKQELPYNKINLQVLTTRELIEISNVCSRINSEISNGQPFRLEFAIDGEQIFLIKIEPISDVNISNEIKEKVEQKTVQKETNVENSALQSEKELRASQISYGSNSPFGDLVHRIPIKSVRERMQENIPERELAHKREERIIENTKEYENMVNVNSPKPKQNININEMIESAGRDYNEIGEMDTIASEYDSEMLKEDEGIEKDTQEEENISKKEQNNVEEYIDLPERGLLFNNEKRETENEKIDDDMVIEREEENKDEVLDTEVSEDIKHKEEY